MGFSKTLSRLADKYYWPNMKDNICEYVRSWEVCQRTQPQNHKPFGLLQPLKPPVSKWTHISMDFTTPLPESTNGHVGFMVTVNRLSKMDRFIPFGKRLDAVKTTKLFKTHIYRRH